MGAENQPELDKTWRLPVWLDFDKPVAILGIANTFAQLFRFRASGVIAWSHPIPIGPKEETKHHF